MDTNASQSSNSANHGGNTIDTQFSFRFMDLPGEIRNKIYRIHFDEHAIPSDTHQTDENHEPDVVSSRQLRQSFAGAKVIFGINQAIRAEAMSLFFRNHFHKTFPNKALQFFHFVDLQATLKAIPEAYQAEFKHSRLTIELKVRLGHSLSSHDPDEPFPALQNIMSKLQAEKGLEMVLETQLKPASELQVFLNIMRNLSVDEEEEALTCTFSSAICNDWILTLYGCEGCAAQTVDVVGNLANMACFLKWKYPFQKTFVKRYGDERLNYLARINHWIYHHTTPRRRHHRGHCRYLNEIYCPSMLTPILRRQYLPSPGKKSVE